MAIMTYTPHQSIAVHGYTIGANTATRTSPPSSSIHFHSDNNKDNSETISIPWLIVGGGIHGVHIAARLVGTGAIPKSTTLSSPSLCIVDDNAQLLQKWKYRTASTGMKYLRSSAGYHLDLEEHSLRRHFGNTNGYNTNQVTNPSISKKKKKRKKNKKKKEQGENNRSHSSSSSDQQQPSLFFTNDYERPRLDIFNQHCDSVITKYGLDKLHTQGRVVSIEPNDEIVKVKVSLSQTDDNSRTSAITYEAEHVVLALGNDEPSYAEWVDDTDIENGLVHHLLDDVKQGEWQPPQQRQEKPSNINNKDLSNVNTETMKGHRVAIVGGGITAAHKALELAHSVNNNNNNESKTFPVVHLISRHPLKEQQFDTHQDWMMDKAACQRSKEGGGSGVPKRQRLFSNISSWEERRKIIAKERIPGTVTPAVNRGQDGLRYAIENKEIIWHQAEVVGKRYITKNDNHNSNDQVEEEHTNCGLELSLSCGDTIEVDQVLLATGFGKKIPGGTLIQKDLVDKAGLQVSKFCGFPIVDENLLWHSRIFVAGALAELEIGPSARNIAGARLAAERILQSIRR